MGQLRGVKHEHCNCYRRSRPEHEKLKRVTKALTYAALILGSIIMIFPFVWMVLTCFKTQAESMAIPPQILPSQWNFDNFVTALESLPFVNLYINTALLIVLRVLCAVVFSSMAGYAFAKLHFPARTCCSPSS